MAQINLEDSLALSIRKNIVRALSDFNMIEEGDRVLVCVSGGKDSSILLTLLQEIQRRAEIQFHLEAAILDQKQPGFQIQEFKNWIESLGVKLHILEKDTYSIVKEKITDGTYCSLCSRLRRAILYDFAHAQGFHKMALGHHATDLVETAFLNLFYTGNMASMPAKLKSDDGRNVIIRPLCYVPEKDLQSLSQQWQFPIIPCKLCGSQDGMKRSRMKKLISDLEKEIPNIQASVLTGLSNVKPSQLLDQKLWNFKDLKGDAVNSSPALESH